MSIKFLCPHCGKSIKCQESLAGKSAQCPGCGERLTVPPLRVEQVVEPVIDPVVERVEVVTEVDVVDVEEYVEEYEEPASEEVEDEEAEAETEAAAEFPFTTESPSWPGAATAPVAPRAAKPAVRSRYQALRIIAVVLKVFAGLAVLIAIGSIVMALIGTGATDTQTLAASVGVMAVVAFFWLVWASVLYALGEAISLLLDVEHNVRAITARVQQLTQEGSDS